MVIKGSTRGHSKGDVAALARHLLNADTNETVKILQILGCLTTDFSAALHEMRAVALGGRASRPLYSASINVAPKEQKEMKGSDWIVAANELESGLGMVGHQRVIVQHRKKGEDGRIREHIHVVWNRIHPASLKAASDGWNYRVHERVARKLEQRFGHKPVLGVHTRPSGAPRPVAKATHRDQQAAARTGISVSQVAGALKKAWRTATTGQEFTQAIEAAGLIIAKGGRGIVVVDSAGTPHSIPRRLGVSAATARKRLQHIDLMRLPSVEEAKSRAKSAQTTREKTMNNTKRTRRPAAARIGAVGAPASYDWNELAEYWSRLGYEVRYLENGLKINLPGGADLYDRGDGMALYRDGPPTNEDLRIMVAAAKARGWKGIHFHGGDGPDWQYRAREEAIRQGYPPHSISLECEKDIKPPEPTPPRPTYPPEKMPEHLLKKLGEWQDETPQPNPEPQSNSRLEVK